MEFIIPNSPDSPPANANASAAGTSPLTSQLKRTKRRSSLCKSVEFESDGEAESELRDSSGDTHTSGTKLYPKLCTKCEDSSRLCNKQRRRRRRSSSCSLVGSYHQNLLSAPIILTGQNSIKFKTKLTVFDNDTLNRYKKPLNIEFDACTLLGTNGDENSSNAATTTFSPYMADLQLPKLFKIPRKGTLQLVVLNSENSGVCLLVVQYDFSQMPLNTRTIFKQTKTTRPSTKMGKEKLIQAIQFQVLSCYKNKVVIKGDVRIVFQSSRVEDVKDYKVDKCVGEYEPFQFDKCDSCGSVIL